MCELSPNFYTWCALVWSFTDGVVNPNPAAVELLVSHGAACFFSVLQKVRKMILIDILFQKAFITNI